MPLTSTEMTEINEIRNWPKSYKRNFILSLMKAKVNEIEQNQGNIACENIKFCYILLNFGIFHNFSFKSVKVWKILVKYC